MLLKGGLDMKKTMLIMTLTLLCGLLLVVTGVPAEAGTVATGTCGDDLIWTLNNNGDLIISGTGNMWENYYNDYSGNDNIYNGPRPSYYDVDIQTVTFMNGVTKIGYAAFNDCKSLTSITIPASVEMIGESNLFCIPNQAFLGCENLISIHVDSGNASYCSVDGVLFNKNMTGLIVYPGGKTDFSYIIPSSVTYIADYAFRDCTNLTQVLYFGTRAQWNEVEIGTENDKLTSAVRFVTASGTCGDDLTWVLDDQGTLTISGSGKMKDYSWNTSPWYSNRSSIRSVSIANGVTSIGDKAFENCSSLTSITIPEGVTSIGSYAFYDCSSLTSITIPESVTSIGDWAFYNCSSLTSITIPESVTSIGGCVFYYCSSLTSITIPEGVKSIGSEAFNDCRKLEKVYYGGTTEQAESINIRYGNELLVQSNWICNNGNIWPLLIDLGITSDGLTWRYTRNHKLIISGEGAINDCSWNDWAESIKTVQICQGVTSIGDWAFACYRSLTSITIPEGVTSIGSYAFDNCSSLMSITIPEGVTYIGECAFNCCSSLTSIIIPESVTSIGSYAFDNCSSLTSISIPEGVTSIGSYAFSNCSSLTSISITEGVTSIGSGAFDNCSSLTSITIPESVTSIGDKAFENCSSLTSITIPESVTSIGECAFYNCSSLTSITIPDNVTGLGVDAFYGCRSLSSIAFPEGFMYIDLFDFTGCDNLMSIEVASDNMEYCSDNGVLFNKNKTTLIWYPAGKNEMIYMIPSSVTSIGSYAFQYCTSLTSISIPEGVTSIDYRAFSNCTSLTSISIPSSMTSIGGYAFYNCTSLQTVYYSGTEKTWQNISIGTNNTPLLNAVQFVTAIGTCGEGVSWVLDNDGTLTIIGTGEMTVFATADDVPWASYRDNIRSVVVEEGIIRVGRYAFCDCTALTDVSLPESLVVLGSWAFSGCSSLKDITLPGRIDQIRNNAFSLCSSLESIVIPQSATRINSYAFSGCTSLASVIIPDSVTDIGVYAFRNCASLTNILIPNGVTTVENGVFLGCAGLTEIILPDSVESIGSKSFQNCTGLTGITIPDSVTGIGANAFSGCAGLTIKVPVCDSYAHRWARENGIAVEALTHQDVQEDAAAEPTCEEPGRTASSHCTVCGDVIVPQKTIEPLGHDWSEITYTWSEDNTSVTAARICGRDETHNETETVSVTAEITNPVTCDEPGQTTYTGDAFTNPAFETQTKTLADIPALGHVWSEPTYTWAEDNTSVTAVRVCGHDASHTETETVSVTAEVNVLVTCEEPGQTTYTSAAFTNPAFETQTKTLTDIPALGHDWSVPTYTWSTDNTSVTATRVCGHDASHTETETVNVTAEVTTPATCTAKGKTTYTSGAFTNPAFQVQTKTLTNIPALGHDWSEPVYTWSADNTSVTAVRVCGHDASHTETETVSVTAEVNVLVTCEEPGQTTYTSAAFTNPAFETQTKTLTDIPALGHDWGVPTYTWSADNTSVTATRVCGHDASHTETETVSVTAEVTKPAACTEKGQTTYTSAAFENIAFAAQTKTLTDVDALGHTPVTDPAVAPTDTVPGLTEGCHCSVCGQVLTEQQILHPLVWGIERSGGSVTIVKYFGESPVVSIPASIDGLPVVEIGQEAFSGANVNQVTIPSSVTSIGDGAFEECTSLTSITIPSSVTNIGMVAFAGCTSLTNISIPEGVESIGDVAFLNCTSLTSVTIPTSVTSLGYVTYGLPAFWYCSSLKSINVAPGNQTYCSFDGVLFNRNMTELLSYPAGKTRADYVIPSGVANIGPYAFGGCAALTAITIPASVTSIYYSAFYECTGLQTVHYSGTEEQWQAISIGDYNESLTSAEIIFPAYIASGSYGSVSWTLDGQGVLTISGTGNMEVNWDYNELLETYRESIRSVMISDGITGICDYAFSGCTGLTNVVLPDSVTAIGDGAFSACTSLTGILLPDSVTAIGESPFPLSTKVYCYEFSFAEAWANDNGYQVELVDAEYLEDALTVSLPAARSVMAGSVSGMGETIFPRLPELEIIWTSSDPAVAEITRDGILYALKGGQTTVTLTAGGKTASCVVTVVQGAESFALPEDIYVVAKQTAQAEVMDVTPADATLELSWITGNNVYATVSQTGLITGKAVGTTTLTVTDAVSGLSRMANLHICYPVTAVTLELSAESLFVGQSAQATATVTARDQTCVNQLVTFSVSSGAIASIDQQGRIRALKPGTVTVTAQAASGKSAACQLTVQAIGHILNLPGSLTKIASQAFLNLTAADAVRIPASVAYIAEDAFDGADVIILAPAGSYAAQWALEHGFTVIEE